MHECDPIGVNGIPVAADEYDSYIPTLGRILGNGDGIDALATELARIRVRDMGLPPRRSRIAQPLWRSSSGTTSRRAADGAAAKLTDTSPRPTCAGAAH